MALKKITSIGSVSRMLMPTITPVQEMNTTLPIRAASAPHSRRAQWKHMAMVAKMLTNKGRRAAASWTPNSFKDAATSQ